MKQFSRYINIFIFINTLLTGSVAFAQTGSVPALPVPPYEYAEIDLPDHFTNPNLPIGNVTGADNTPINNPISNAGATLGRVLFYDKRLSVNEAVSCSSCHHQAHGFSDPDVLSTGFDGRKTGRHSMGLSNSRYYERGHFFWDERADTLEDQALMPIQDPVEMNMNLDDLVSKLEQTEFYPDLFRAAFNDESITSERISLALSQFVRSLVSYQSKFDLGFGNGGANPLTTQERFGRHLFSASQNQNANNRSLGCARCHTTAAQISVDVKNNGLDLNTDADQGAGGGRFKAPSLRDVAARPPYMHDGRFETLEEVVEFYSSGIQDHPQLSSELREDQDENAAAVKLNMSEEEKAALVAFLETLTDPFLLNDIRFSDPFAEPVASLDVFSGSWYDPTHDGEGWVVEVLDDDSAVIYWFTYDQDGNQVWMLGVAQRNGKALTADMLITSGARFGADFDPADVEYKTWGTLTFTMESCQSARVEYASEITEFGSGSLKPQRLVSVDGLNCERPSKAPVSQFSGWTGSWYDPSHDGEGWVVESIDDTRAVVYWFTYDDTGGQVWMIGVANRVGNSLQVDMQTTSGPTFGTQFDPADIKYTQWGSVQISFTNCNNAVVDYTSELPAFGSGQLQPQRLTRLSGIECQQQ